MDKSGNITISYDTWKQGIKSPHIGMGDMVNVDIFDKTGVMKLALKPTALATSNFTDIPSVISVIPGSSDVYIGDLDGELYTYDVNSDSLTAETDGSSGMADGVWWKDYLIVTDRSLSTVHLDAYDGSSWENNWDTLTADSSGGGFYTKIHSSPADNDLYVGYDRYIARISAIGTFDPASGGTFTTIDKFLTLPNGYVVRDITTVANFLVCSASLEGAGSNTTLFTGARLYYWDLSQTATAAVEWTGFVDVNTNVASPLIPYNNNVYYYKWQEKKWGVTNLSIINDTFEIEVIDGQLEGKKDCVDYTANYFALGLSATPNSDTPAGIYLINGESYTRNILSTGEVGSNNAVDIRFVMSVGLGKYLVGYEDNGTYVVDLFGKSNYRYESGYCESPMYNPGFVLNGKSYQQFDITLSKKLSTGQGIKLYYRENLTDDWTEFNYNLEPNFTNYGAVSKINGKSGIMDMTTVQFKVELITGASSTTTPELISVKIY